MPAEEQCRNKEWQNRYRNGFFLAPMVRIGTLPFRLLCLEYGADLVWTSEIIDKSIVGATREVDEKSGVISYIKRDKDVFTTHPSEKEKVVFQLGTADPDLALEAAKTVEKDVSGVDLNCGCPKKFSVSGGMGAALMSDPDRLCAILEKLVQGLDIPVTCKIRVFDDVDQTLRLVRRIAATGISALTVHCRTRAMRPSEKAMWYRLNDIVKELPDLPVILNGDIFEHSDVQRARDETGATSVMTARGAEENPSIFRVQGKLSVMETAVALTKLAVQTSNVFINTKYILLKMYPDTKSKSFEILNKSRSYKQMCEAMGLTEYYETEGVHLIHERSEPSKTRIKPGKQPQATENAGKRKSEEQDKTVAQDNHSAIPEEPAKTGTVQQAVPQQGSGSETNPELAETTDVAEAHAAKRLKA
ncbi:tRNA-dihydrouridine synthase 2 [Coemansia sp. RSA 1286]|nr:tRNA-dihydrouridine synthase 2 [Coemansia sp. RSA 1286]